MISLKEMEKYYKDINQEQKWGHPKEASFWSKLTLGWLDEYLKKASNGNQRNPSDYPKILESDSTILWANKLEEEIMRMNSKKLINGQYNLNIFMAVFNILKSSLLKIMFGKLFCECLGMLIVICLKLSLKKIETILKINNIGKEYYSFRKEGIIMAIFIGTLQMLLIFSSTQLGYYICRQTVRIQGSITHVLYRSVLSRGINRINTDSINLNGDTTSIYNSILIDMNTVVKVITSIVDVIIIPIRLLLVLTILTRNMGGYVLSRPAMYCIIFISFLVVVLELCVALFKWSYLIKRDNRMNLMDFMIRKISSIKFLGWESLFYWIINNSRIEEVNTRKKFIFFQSISSVLYSTSNLITQYTLFKTIVIFSALNKFDIPPSGIITSYFVIDLFSQRLADLPILISTIVEGNNSRIRMEPVIKHIIIRNLEIQESIRRENEFFGTLNDLKNQISCFESNTNTEDGHTNEDHLNMSININIDDETGNQKFKNFSENTIVLIKNVELINEIYDDRININMFQVERNYLTIVEDHSSERLIIFIQAILGYNDFNCQIGPRINNSNDSIFYIRKITSLPIFWCSHDPWIPSGTIQSIIVCGSPMVKDIYDKVLFTCDLNEDINSWKEKDLRFVDNKQGLSGGQIARIGLARAIYRYYILKMNDPEFDHLFILDNCFRSVDVPVSINILLRLFTGQNAILHESNTILVISPILKDILFSRSVGTFSCSIREYKFRNEGIVEGYALFKKTSSEGNIIKYLGLNSSDSNLIVDKEKTDINTSLNEDYNLLIQKNCISENQLVKIIQSKDSSPLLEEINEYGSVSYKTYKSYLSSINKMTLFLILVGIFITVLGGLVSQFGLTYILDIICNTNNKSVDTEIVKGNAPISVMPYGPSRNIDLRKHVSRFVLDKFKGPLEMILGINVNNDTQVEFNLNQLVSKFGYLLFFIVLATFSTYALEAVACIQACKYYHNNLLYKILINSSIPTLIKIPSGQILNKFSTDIILIDWNTMRSFGRVTWGFVSFTVNIFILSILAPWTLPIFIFIMVLILKKIFLPMISASRNLQRANLVAFSPLCSIMSSTLEGSRTIFLLKNGEYFEKMSLNILEYMQRIRLLQHTSLIWCNTRIQLFILPISIINSIFPFVTPVIFNLSKNNISNSFIAYYLNLLSQPITIAWGISKCLSLAENATCLMADYIQMEKEMCSVERIIELMDQITSKDNERNYIPHKDEIIEKNLLLGLKKKSSKKILFIHKDNSNQIKKTYDNIFVSLLSANDLSNHRYPVLSVNNVSIDYEIPNQDNNCNYILNNISMKAYNGEVIGIIGRTGSGKSSLFNAILNISPIISGNISIMGESIHSIPRHRLRNKIGVIPQALCILPNCTVRDIIDPFLQFNDNEVHSVLKICGIYKYINNNLNGIYSKIILQKNSLCSNEENNCKSNSINVMGNEKYLVGNENQLFVISEIYLRYLYTCRILLYSKNYHLILIDEPIVFQNDSSLTNSSMNEQTMQIIDIISTYCSHCAVITISHDINIIKKCKRIYHLLDGVLNEISFVKTSFLN